MVSSLFKRVWVRFMVLPILMAALAFFSIFYFFPGQFLTWRLELQEWHSGFEKKSLAINEKFTISYYEKNSGAKETVVLIPGFGSFKALFLPFAKIVAEKYHVIIIDMPGFGESSKIAGEDYLVPAQVKRLLIFLDKKKLPRVHLAGNSLGALFSAATHLSAPGRVKSLGLFAPPGAASAKPSRTFLLRKQGMNAFDVTNVAEYRNMLSLAFHEPPWVPGHIAEHLMAEAKAGRPFLNFVLHQMESKQRDFEPFMKDIKAPTLLIWGKNDQILDVSGAKVFHQNIAGSQLHILPECGHLPYNEKPEVTAGYYLEFLNKVVSSRKEK